MVLAIVCGVRPWACLYSSDKLSIDSLRWRADLIDGFEAEVGRDIEDFGVGGDGVSEPDVGADDASCADDRITAQDACARIDGDVVFDGGVSFGVTGFIGIRDTEGAESDALINFDVIADLGCFADDDTGAVIDKDAMTDLCCRMDVDTGAIVDVFTHHARQDGNTELVKAMGEAVDGQCAHAGVAQDDLCIAFGGWIALVCGFEIAFQKGSYRGECFEEGESNLGGLFFGGRRGGWAVESAVLA